MRVRNGVQETGSCCLIISQLSGGKNTKKTNRDYSKIFWQKRHQLSVRLMFNIVRKQQKTAQYEK